MALDLTVTETQLDDEDSANASNCVLLYSEAITIPGTSDILFEVSSSGRLILANFSIERRNGSYFLEKLGGVPMSSLSPEHPTNLSVDKAAFMHDDSKQHMSLSALSLHGDLNSSCSHPLAGDIEHWTVALDAADSMPQNLSTVVHNTRHVSKEESLEHAQIEDLSIAEKPVDATLPRSHLGSIRCTANVNLPQSRDSEDSILMGQFVKTLLKEHETRNGGNASDLVLLGNNLSELQRFVKRFKTYRHSIGLSQYQLSCELAKHYNQQTMFSQSLLSRFELLSVTVRAAFRLLPYLRNWLEHAEREQLGSTAASLSLSPSARKSVNVSMPVRALGKSRYATLVRLGYPPGYMNGANHSPDPSAPSTVNASDEIRTVSNPNDESSNLIVCPAAKSRGDCSDHLISSPNCRLADPETRLCRRERTHFTIATRAILAAAYEKNPHPKGQELTRLALETGHNRESIRIWFCNRRQLTNQTKEHRGSNT